jgi:hypothetical protein
MTLEQNNWDPLTETLTEEIKIATIKREIKNILKSYTGWYDPFSELIQNSLDALEHRMIKEPKHTPELWIEINLKENRICVTDNGIGFSEDKFHTFLAPFRSFKGNTDRGNKGVGATYLGYGFNFLQAGTKTPEYTFVGNFLNGRDWVDDNSGSVTRPKISKSNPLHDVFKNIDRGTTMCLILSGSNVRPGDLNGFGATNADQWDKILRIKTPLGGIYFGQTPIQVKCHITVIDKEGKITHADNEKCEYIYPHKELVPCKSLNEIRDEQKKLLSEKKDASKLSSPFMRLNGLYNFWDYKDLLSDEYTGRFTTQQKQLAEHYKVKFYGFFGYSTNLWDYYNDEIIGLPNGNRILNSGLQIATNGMPQGELIQIPLTKNIGYQRVAHVIVHFEQAEPDLGRKGFQPELTSLAKKIATTTITNFLVWRKCLRKDTGAPPNIAEDQGIYEWIKAQEKHEAEKPLKILNKKFFIPVLEPALTSEPLNEQDVIALFNQLLAGGVIRGIRVLSTSQSEQYDGIFKYFLTEPLDLHIFNEETNPLGIERSRTVKPFNLSAPKILEYKYSFNGLIEDIIKEEKNETNIALVIVWEMGNKWKDRYEIVPLLHNDNLHHRYFHGGTHIVHDKNTGVKRFDMIVLSELINYINDTKASQNYQFEKYMKN